MKIKNSVTALLLLLFVSTGEQLYSQPNDMPRWRALFEKPFDKIHAADRFLWDAISQKAPSEIKAIIHALEDDKSVNKSPEAIARIGLLKTMYCNKFDSLYDNEGWKVWGNRSVALARNAGDDYSMQGCCLFLGDAYLKMNNYDTAVFYLMKTVELSEKLGNVEDFIVSNKIAVSNVLYRTQNYRQCIDHCVSNYDIENHFVPITVMSAYNNAGLSYLALNNLDSALYYFNKAVVYASGIKWGIWEGIILGYIGTALHKRGEDEKAIVYWQRNYDSSFKYKEWGNASSTLAYISEYEFNHGQQAKGISHLQLATAQDRSDPARDPFRTILIDKIKSDCYRKLGLHDSADHFLDEHYRLQDSMNQVVSRNNYNLVTFRLAFEKSNYEYDILKKEREAEIERRNLLLVALLASLLAGLLLYNRERLKARLAQQKTANAEAEKRSAYDQLQTFTQILLEKNQQIEQLTSSLVQQTTTNVDELIHQSLLTDSDWKRFKDLFEKIHPDFFSRLREISPGITQSEMRLASLIKLNLGNKEMASMQGISVSSLRGNKTRLRQKLGISADTDLEEFIKLL